MRPVCTLCPLSPFSLRTTLGQEDDWESGNENIFLGLQSFFFCFFFKPIIWRTLNVSSFTINVMYQPQFLTRETQ